jgi:hypothetical protein
MMLDTLRPCKVLAFMERDLYSYTLFSSIIISEGYGFLTFSAT